MNKTISSLILAILAVDAMFDLAFLNAIGISDTDDEDTDKHPLIGRRYIVNDNSYAIDKESGARVSGLHDKEYIIVSDPYVEKVYPFFSKEEGIDQLFVDVFSIDSARKYRVIFQERSVVKED